MQSRWKNIEKKTFTKRALFSEVPLATTCIWYLMLIKPLRVDDSVFKTMCDGNVESKEWNTVNN